MYENIKTVGLPEWSEADQTLARAVQKEMKTAKISGLDTKVDSIRTPVKNPTGGGSDDIADISWNVPTVVLNYPSNIPGLPGHHWSNAITMATPIAHKGVTAGAKVEALTLLDMLVNPEIIKNAWSYFNEVQTKEIKYIPFVTKTSKPPIYLNKAKMDEFRPAMKKYYYDPTKYSSYLEQLGIKYPTLRTPDTKTVDDIADKD
jgi:aminobenzoyl-glutamate utilization protein B